MSLILNIFEIKFLQHNKTISKVKPIFVTKSQRENLNNKTKREIILMIDIYMQEVKEQTWADEYASIRKGKKSILIDYLCRLQTEVKKMG